MVAHFLRSLSYAYEEHEVENGRSLYGQFCVACHGAAGEGKVLLGAPNLTDSVWMYGGALDDIEQTIAFGRHGHMPAFNDRLDDTQIRMLLAWLTRN